MFSSIFLLKHWKLSNIHECISSSVWRTFKDGSQWISKAPPEIEFNVKFIQTYKKNCVLILHMYSYKIIGTLSLLVFTHVNC